jgi:hypothetical protein
VDCDITTHRNSSFYDLLALVFRKDFITKSGEMSLSTGNGIIISFSNSFMARRTCIDDVIKHSFNLKKKMENSSV